MRTVIEMSVDRLIIEDLRVDCRIGIFDWEQATPQTISIDLELAIDAARAAARDDVGDAVDYGQLVTAARELAQGKPYRLLETLAEAIAGLILGGFEVPQVTVRVKKRALPGIGSAAVEVQRSAARERRARRARPAGRLRSASTGSRR